MNSKKKIIIKNIFGRSSTLSWFKFISHGVGDGRHQVAINKKTVFEAKFVICMCFGLYLIQLCRLL